MLPWCCSVMPQLRAKVLRAALVPNGMQNSWLCESSGRNCCIQLPNPALISLNYAFLPDHIQCKEQQRQVHHRGWICQHHLQGGGDQWGRLRLREAGQGEEGRVWADSPHYWQNKQQVTGTPLQIHHQGVWYQRQRPCVRTKGVQWICPRNVTSRYVLPHSSPFMAGVKKWNLY